MKVYFYALAGRVFPEKLVEVLKRARMKDVRCNLGDVWKFSSKLLFPASIGSAFSSKRGSLASILHNVASKRPGVPSKLDSERLNAQTLFEQHTCLKGAHRHLGGVWKFSSKLLFAASNRSAFSSKRCIPASIPHNVASK
ncbi:hypothetical protein SLL00_04545 [Metabacillus indicus]|uniref:hypothetical protein n=1 Tax=Metabacillus indicus TaxID=246786 RepID=UPI002A001C17|nr:hypothetical protein [Metabacillus indicus]MDX8289044.1 hypothetical protein [Metabacillus indicus]